MSDESSGLKEDRKNLLKRAFAMAQGTLTSRILGLFRDIAMGALFDRAITDAWVAAFRLPNFFRRLLGEGLLSGAFIPLYIQSQKEDPSGVKAQAFLNAVATSLLSFIATLCVIAILWMHPLLSLLMPQHSMNTAAWEWTVLSGQIMFFFVFFVTASALSGAVLQARGLFGWVGLAPALLNVSMLVFTFLPQHWFHFPGESLAWGVLIGGLFQAVLLWGVAFANGIRLQVHGQGASEPVKKFYRALLLAMTGVGVFQFSGLIHLYFVSQLGEGALSALYWADRLMELPLALVSVTLGASLLPTLSKWSVENKKNFWILSEETLLLGLFWAVPAAVGLALFAEPIIQLLFVRGEFQQADLARTVAVLQLQALSLIAMSVNRILLPIYYSRHQNAFPLWISALGLGLQIIGSSVLDLNSQDQVQGLRSLMGVGLAAHTMTSLVLLIGLGKEFPWRPAAVSLLQIAVSASSLFVVLIGFRALSVGTSSSFWGRFFLLLFAILISVGCFFFIAVKLKNREALKVLSSSRLQKFSFRK